MSRETIVSVQRGKQRAMILPYVPVRLEEISAIVIASSGGAIPNTSTTLFSRVGIPDIRQGDFLTDTVTGEQWRVSGQTETYDNSYLKVMIDKNLEQLS